MSTTRLPESYKRNPHLHAYLYVSGDLPERRETAKLLAKSMLCENSAPDGEPCGNCSCCKKAEAGTHPDCIFFSDREKTKVEDVRKIEEEAYLSTNEADSKVFILEDADEYNVQSQNALLKIMEEPPKGVKFILTASSVSAILPTVRSRVCTLSGNVKSIDDIADEIKKAKPHLDDSKVKLLSHFVSGYDKADTENLNETLVFDYAQKAHAFLSGKDLNTLTLLPKKREELLLCLQVFMLCLRQIAYVKATGKMTDGILSEKELSECNSKTSMKKAHALYDVFENACLLTEDYANINAVLSYLLMNAR